MTATQRWIRSIGYGFIGCGGIAVLVWPSFSAQGPMSLTGGPILAVWGALLAIGGLTSAVGSASGMWLGEYAGLWPMIITFLIFGFASAVSGSLVQLALSLTILGWSFLLFARWREVALIREQALRFSRYQQRAGGPA